MRVLIACECSGVVRDAFRAKGHQAYSCDLLDSPRPSPSHIVGNALHQLGGKWDLLIAHPPCDYLTNSAAWAFKNPDNACYPGVGYHQKVKPGTLTGHARRQARAYAARFFLELWDVPIARIVIENPIGFMNTHPRLDGIKPQIIQPHQFGEDASKATCLWLKGIPPLVPTQHVAPRFVCQQCKATWSKGWAGEACACGSTRILPRWANQTDTGQNKLSPSDDRASVRAVTYAGIAAAMAAQWSNL